MQTATPANSVSAFDQRSLHPVRMPMVAVTGLGSRYTKHVVDRHGCNAPQLNARNARLPRLRWTMMMAALGRAAVCGT